MFFCFLSLFFCFCGFLLFFPAIFVQEMVLHAFIVYSFFCLSPAAVQSADPAAAGKDSLLVVFWNLENYFSPAGRMHWTKSRFIRKSNAVAKSIFSIADSEGRLPDVIGVAEVENAFVLESLVSGTPLRKVRYGIVHYDSPDPRGIDVAILYRKDILKLVDSAPVEVCATDGLPLGTRDILKARFLRRDGDTLAFLVNHHPSKYGSGSGWKREAAMATLSRITRELLESGTVNIIAMGDFNDTPASTEEYSRIMVNLAIPLAGRGEGTIKYEGKWELIDMFFVSPELERTCGPLTMKVERIPFLTVKDNVHSGEKPLRSFSGPRYSGGVSDHRPIVLVIQ